MARIRISEMKDRDDAYKARIESNGKEGEIDRKYVSKAAQKKVAEYGVAHVNQPKERVL